MENWDQTFINIANIISKHSTCIRVNVGVVIVRDGRILSTGYNGSPSKFQHCKDVFANVSDLTNLEFIQQHRQFSDKYEIHSEINAILYAAKNGIGLYGSKMYVTHSPCTNCSKIIISSGIIEVVYDCLYDRDPDGVLLLKDGGILVRKFNEI